MGNANTSQSRINFNLLGSDVIRCILKQLPYDDLLPASRVCKLWKNLVAEFYGPDRMIGDTLPLQLAVDTKNVRWANQLLNDKMTVKNQAIFLKAFSLEDMQDVFLDHFDLPWTAEITARVINIGCFHAWKKGYRAALDHGDRQVIFKSFVHVAEKDWKDHIKLYLKSKTFDTIHWDEYSIIRGSINLPTFSKRDRELIDGRRCGTAEVGPIVRVDSPTLDDVVRQPQPATWQHHDYGTDTGSSLSRSSSTDEIQWS
ncbi:hypothetical protein PROFUN_10904 [Planoprotostelium fungivorum]|uniref:F-box domain-containing protein n=1 Tax=Planoprotostelium fungivorum TaxID=1890364 RepID=A0A2P6NC87_9EUKA|nr:hypothetical protein PROFUN_10904 [Planoprotostelium fungivorum]